MLCKQINIRLLFWHPADRNIVWVCKTNVGQLAKFPNNRVTQKKGNFSYDQKNGTKHDPPAHVPNKDRNLIYFDPSLLLLHNSAQDQAKLGWDGPNFTCNDTFFMAVILDFCTKMINTYFLDINDLSDQSKSNQNSVGMTSKVRRLYLLTKILWQPSWISVPKWKFLFLALKSPLV